MQQSNQLVRLMEIAIMTSLALVLDYLSGLFLRMPNGGSLALIMIPVILMSIRWGVSTGFIIGVLIAGLQLMNSPIIATPVQGFLDYFVASVVISLSGLFSGLIKKAIQDQKRKQQFFYITLAVFIASFFRLLTFFISGVVFFSQYAPKGTPGWVYSLIYNSTYMVPSFIICSIVLCILIPSASRLVFPRQK
ncbi:energy-coupled thiamine transporter ThiT [Bacillus safensis]|uniref:energy-coupled thiamine transporter ThiT n=1 Tax=Bacillus safensis TaxID=561879 RepID=UPI002282C348|nr:energy-coupled thiamine transporter ThiT [Bacillus safensis]MCY7677023.1 energy-coupled thiamine transporter ThiT [Bacillus safensis]MCY7699087.1 energy-coupled thiamine transporter ThiT [Bacillus safensis]MEC3628912.1 energy-coupled thiamine transporter ThiT [Bacillus safensis]